MGVSAASPARHSYMQTSASGTMRAALTHGVFIEPSQPGHALGDPGSDDSCLWPAHPASPKITSATATVFIGITSAACARASPAPLTSAGTVGRGLREAAERIECYRPN